MKIKRLEWIYSISFSVSTILGFTLFGTYVIFQILNSASALNTATIELFLYLFLFLGTVVYITVITMITMKIRITAYINNMMYCHLDADSAMCVLSDSLKVYGRRKPSFGYHMLLSLVYDLKGEYQNALKEYLNIKNGLYSKKIKLGLLYFYLRCCQIDNAKEIVRNIQMKLKYTTQQDVAFLHTAGLYYLEIGEMEKARECLSMAFKKEAQIRNGQFKIARLNCAFDLARLDEKEGSIQEAIEHYRQAAALGPKTWIGQESARRAEALSIKG
jgi:tetratricopeptide (TPR) repeat protein